MAMSARAAAFRQPWRHATRHSYRSSESSSSFDDWRLSLAVLLASAAGATMAATATTSNTSAATTLNDDGRRSPTVQRHWERTYSHDGASIHDIIKQMLQQQQEQHAQRKVRCETRHLHPPPYQRIDEVPLTNSIQEEDKIRYHQWNVTLMAQSSFSPVLHHRHHESKHKNNSTAPTKTTTTTTTQSMDDMNRKYKVDYNTVLGEGSYGIVHPANIIVPQQPPGVGGNYADEKVSEEERTAVALKKISKSNILKSSSSTSEIDALLRIYDCGGHPNISGLRDIYEDESHFYLFLDLARG